jgi:Xaa-Pro aminopeptidase
MAQMKPKALLFFNSNDIYPVSADSTSICTAPRHLYLSGADQEESILLLFPDALMSINEK